MKCTLSDINGKKSSLESVEGIINKFKANSKDIKADICKFSNARRLMKNSSVLQMHRNTWRKEIHFAKCEEGYNYSLWKYDDESKDSKVYVNSGDVQQQQDVLWNCLTSFNREIKKWNEVHLKSDYALRAKSTKKLNTSTNSSSQELEGGGRNEKVNYLESKHKDKSFTCIIKNIGIPECAWDWKCSDDEYLPAVLSEFILMDWEFYNRLEIVRKEYETLRLMDIKILNLKELEIFEYICNVYKRHVMHQRRYYTLDFMSRLFNKCSIKELISLLDHYERRNHLKDRAVSIKRTWKKSRDDLSIRIQATLSQIEEISNEQRIKAEKHEHQKELCNLLKKQVQRWRKEKLEISQLEEKENAKRRLQQEKAQALKKAKENKIRQATKAEITEYQLMKIKAKEQEEQNDANRLKYLRQLHAKQSFKDMARLKEAHSLYLSEIKQKKLSNYLEKERLANEREKRFESLRKKVRPSVLPDLNRLMSGTESWIIKADRSQENNENVSQNQLDNVNRFGAKLFTYTNAQLCADNRTRLTMALHNVGLLNSDYARLVLSNTTSNHPIRKDTITSKELHESLREPINN
ncbi:Coiled-coil domain-containing protein [Schistosoma japonicum]|nr:Coiled-coil domain-containing protein [Schistosoma japonicum]